MANGGHEDASSEMPSDAVTDAAIRRTGHRPEDTRARLLLVVESGANRDQLATWLSKYHTVETLEDRPIADALGRCDLCLIDGTSFAAFRDELAAGKAAAQPTYLPYLLVLTGTSQSDPRKDVWDAVDDVIETPIRQAELRGRIESLLRARRYSVDLKQQNDRLEQFVDIVSHDLRNPLGIAKGFLDFAREDGDSDDFERVEDALNRMDEIIEDLLTLARTGAAITETEPIDPADVAKTAWRTVSTTEATLMIEIDDRMEVYADESRLIELFENLFRNAVEHAGARARIRVGRLEDEAGFYVADDGPGIPESERDAVFEYGYTTAESGTGFGLAIVKSIVDAHEWSVRVTDAETGGARFDIGCETTRDIASPDNQE